MCRDRSLPVTSKNLLNPKLRTMPSVGRRRARSLIQSLRTKPGFKKYRLGIKARRKPQISLIISINLVEGKVLPVSLAIGCFTPLPG